MIFGIIYNIKTHRGWDNMRYILEKQEHSDILCAKSVSMTYGDNLHRDNKYSHL